jgi:hypothetical protein
MISAIPCTVFATRQIGTASTFRDFGFQVPMWNEVSDNNEVHSDLRRNYQRMKE